MIKPHRLGRENPVGIKERRRLQQAVKGRESLAGRAFASEDQFVSLTEVIPIEVAHLRLNDNIAIFSPGGHIPSLRDLERLAHYLKQVCRGVQRTVCLQVHGNDFVNPTVARGTTGTLPTIAPSTSKRPW